MIGRKNHEMHSPEQITSQVGEARSAIISTRENFDQIKKSHVT